jgi:hypothetical protein
MCLYANKDHPLEGMHPIEFDKDGYVTCYKIYSLFKSFKKRLQPPHQGGVVESGLIVSDRESKEISSYNGDSDDDENNIFEVYHGIHVSLTREEAEREVDEDDEVIVPVRCHEDDLIASCTKYPDAVFMKVFLEKADYKKALKR